MMAAGMDRLWPMGSGMRKALAKALIIVAAWLLPAAAQAGVGVQVDLSTQRMTVTEDGRVRHVWAISSGRPGYRTPTGTYRPQRLARMHYSRTYDLAPMPHSIFFTGGYAIHGTGEVRRLGRTASHGCIRLSKAQAAELYRLVQARGLENTRISISGDASLADAAPARPRLARATERDHREMPPRRVVRRAPFWDDEGVVYTYAPARTPLEGFWVPRGYYRR